MGFLFSFFSLLFLLLYIHQPAVPEPNTAPVIDITSPQYGYSSVYGGQTNFTAIASDHEDGDLAYSVIWISSIDGNIDKTVVLSEGTHTITAKVVDSDGLSATDSIVISIIAPSPENTAPTIEITSPKTGFSFEEGYSFLFKATASDQEDGNLTNSVIWESSMDGKIADLTTLSVGSHVITAFVTDSGGLTTEDSISVSVNPVEVVSNRVEINWNTPQYRDDGSPLAIEDIGGYEITLDGKNTGEESVIDLNDGYATSLLTEPMQPDIYTLTMRTYDGDGLLSAATSPVIIVVGDL